MSHTMTVVALMWIFACCDDLYICSAFAVQSQYLRKSLIGKHVVHSISDNLYVFLYCYRFDVG